MSPEQIKQIEHSFKHGDNLVFTIGDRVFVTDTILKHRKESTIEFLYCNEIDISCFEADGDYYGDVLPGSWRIILQDHYADEPNIVESSYYEDEIITIRKEN